MLLVIQLSNMYTCVFVAPVRAFKWLSNTPSHWKAGFKFREVTDERHLAELLQELFKLDTFSEVRFYEELERNSIGLFNQWLHQQYEASLHFCNSKTASQN